MAGPPGPRLRIWSLSLTSIQVQVSPLLARHLTSNKFMFPRAQPLLWKISKGKSDKAEPPPNWGDFHREGIGVYLRLQIIPSPLPKNPRRTHPKARLLPWMVRRWLAESRWDQARHPCQNRSVMPRLVPLNGLWRPLRPQNPRRPHLRLLSPTPQPTLNGRQQHLPLPEVRGISPVILR